MTAPYLENPALPSSNTLYSHRPCLLTSSRVPCPCLLPPCDVWCGMCTAHWQIYAGCDMILVPSMFEPCGLTQLIAMRYGAVPVVRKTGGLNDTVFDVDNDHDRARAQGKDVNGFSFEGADAAGLDYALDRAISGWYDGREWWNGLAKRVMEQDWTWNRPALDYLELYYGARK
ncbi:unnamed protein product [Closterium sp. NIES-54]